MLSFNWKLFWCKESSLHSRFCSKAFKGATKLHFVHYSRVVITLLSMDLHKSAFSTYSFGETRFSSFYVLIFRVFVSLVLRFFVVFWIQCHVKRLKKIYKISEYNQSRVLYLIPQVTDFGLGHIKKTSLFQKYAIHSKIFSLSKLYMNVKVSSPNKSSRFVNSYVGRVCMLRRTTAGTKYALCKDYAWAAHSGLQYSL